MLSRYLKEGHRKKNPSASSLVGFQSSLVPAKGSTVLEDHLIAHQTTWTSGMAGGSGEFANRVGRSVPLSVNHSSTVVGRSMGTVCPEVCTVSH